jgi:predicted nucleotidyltransferase
VNFSNVIKLLHRELTKAQIDFALVGGFAVSCYIKPRFTQDIDIIVFAQDSDKINKILTGFGYKLKFKSENIETYISDDYELGRIDLQLAFRKYGVAMLDHANRIEILPDIRIKVLRPEDLIGLKVQAINNDPSRYFQDMSDIENMMRLEICKDMDKIKEYFELFDKVDEYNKLIKKLGKG